MRQTKHQLAPQRELVQPNGQIWLFQPLTLVRQIGTQREQDGTTTYTFGALVHPDLEPVKMTLTLTPASEIRVTACFDATLRYVMKEEREEEKKSQEVLLWAR